MTVTADSPFKAAPRITRQDFKTIIERDANPTVALERDPGLYWDAIKATGVDPLFLLAMFNHESTLGKFGMATKTFSWGNTRPPSFGVPQLGVVNGFSSYRDWLDGCKSTAARLVDPGWVYANRTSIHEIFDHPSGQVWAPAGDNNDPKGYLRAVLDYMNVHASVITQPDVPSDALYGPTSVPTPADIGNAVWVQWAADTGPQRPMSDIKWGVVHKTEGNKAGDIPTLTRKDDNLASAHAWIGRNGEVVWMVPLGTTAWTAGNEFVNDHSINFELEGQEDEPTTAAQYASLANLFRFARKCGCPFPFEYVGKDERPGLIGHYDVGNPLPPTDPQYCGPWGGRSCHRDPGALFDFSKLVSMLTETTPFPEPDEDARSFKGQNIPWKVKLGFKAYWEELEQKGTVMRDTGYPKNNEIAPVPLDGIGSAQEFDRAWFVWEPGVPAPYDVRHATLDQVKALEALRHG